MNRKLKLDELKRISVEEFRNAEKIPVVIVLDNIRSLHNIGSVFRTADAFRIERICLCGITAVPPHREIHKTALGATETVDWKHFSDVKECILDLKDSGYRIAGVEQTEKSIMLTDYKPDKLAKQALVFGNEITGISDSVIALADEFIEIPQFGTKHSFNISVSAGILMWEFYKSKKG
jgi:23S rRNA (guanosine2251-2'-O)-methyltransferase